MVNKRCTFLVAIGTDELPSKFLKKIGQDFCYHINNEFKKNNIFFDSINWFASPRHLAIQSVILIKNNKDCISDINNQSIFFKKNNIRDNNNIKSDMFQSKFISEKKCVSNKDFQSLLLTVIKNSLNRLINYEMMRWSNIKTPFIRPVNTMTVLLDSDLISGAFFGKDIDRIIYGHRYIKHNKLILNHANDYAEILKKKGCVLVDYKTRKEVIRTAVKKQAFKIGGVIDIKDDSFLEEITALIEWPVVLYGRFDKRFLALPNELIIHIMKYEKKYFPVYSIINNVLLPYFIIVINTITDDYKRIIKDHENIIQTRFIDAEFFLKNDSRYRLEDSIYKLSSIIFHRKLGSLKDKVDRITELSGWIASQINENILLTRRAGYLCKCDLTTNMVLEFPEMQGIIGMYYARRDGESEEVALAQKEHYQPKNSEDTLPIGKISCIVSIADKMDTISGIFGVKEFPTGSRDPFGLKRASVGILNIIIRKKIPLNLFDLIHNSVLLYKLKLDNIIDLKNNIYKFMSKRLCLYYCSLGYRLNIVKSILNTKFFNIMDCSLRINSVNDFYNFQKEEGFVLRVVYKRISNILKKQNMAEYNETLKIQDTLLIASEEIQLFIDILDVKKKLKLFINNSNYCESLKLIVNLSKSSDKFLNNVLVMHDQQNIRINRLGLIRMVKYLILKVVDVSVLYL